jgi:hypothetical protein
MNPQDQNQPTPDTPDTQFGAPSSPAPSPDFTNSSQVDTSNDTVPAGDAAALQQIESLESESTTPEPMAPIDPTVEPTQPGTLDTPAVETDSNPFAATPQPVTPTATEQPFTEQAAADPVRTTPVEPAAPIAAAPVAAAVNDPSSKKPSKVPLIVLGVVALIALLVVGYMLWQSTQSTDTTPSDNSSEVITPETETPTGGSLPGGAEKEVLPTDDTETPAAGTNETTTPVTGTDGAVEVTDPNTAQ